MSSDLAGSIILLVVCLCLSFVFSAAETAVTAAGKMKVKALEASHPHRRSGLAWLADHIQNALTVALVGNNIVNIAASAVATVAATSLLGAGAGPFAAVAIMATVVVIFCEILPKNLAVAEKERVILIVLPMLRLCSVILSPIIIALQAILKLIGRIFGREINAFETFVSREELEIMVSASEESGELEEEERRMISGVIAFEDTRVSEIMHARTDMTVIRSDATVREASKLFLDSGHSRVPIYENDVDRITGVLYIKDLIEPMMDGKFDSQVREMGREPLFLPETIRSDEAFELMKRSKVHIAIVVDEYGGTAGLITLEDLIEEIVGDIQDEYDDEMPDVLEERDGVYLVQGGVNLEDLSEELGFDFRSDDVDTVAGMMLSIKGNFPERNESVDLGPWRMTALDVRDHRIMQIRLERIAQNEEQEVV